MSAWAEQWDSPLRWSVRSQSSGAIYIVDLGAWECQCTRHRCGPRGQNKPHDELFREGWSRLNHDIQCFHKVTALRAFYAEYVEPRIAEMPILKEFLTRELSGYQDALALAFVNYLSHEENRTEAQDSVETKAQDGKGSVANPVAETIGSGDGEAGWETEGWTPEGSWG